MDMVEARRLLIGAHLVRAADGGQSEELAWFRSGAPHEELNGILHARASKVSEGIAAMGAVPALWHSWESDRGGAEFEAGLRRRGFALVEEEPVMIAELRQPPGLQGLPDHDIRLVRSVAELAQWARVWTGGEPDLRLVDALARTGIGHDSVVKHFLAQRNGRTVGCFALVKFDGDAALEHIATAPGFRGQGIGTFMTKFAMQAARDDGARKIALTASPDGDRIYRRLGFVEVDRVRRYRAPQEVISGVWSAATVASDRHEPQGPTVRSYGQATGH